ncbi:homoserine O-acetyltransferase [Synchytrium microbalum]|uniref:Homoserine O-acetyltransferase n=1 Tax=Synchytrium microbalum TaxID=1806994 RepID=A0A507BSG9_9FUNG|nr:homoserine O-acetyltransferase [Synchytrium microbalum]TPX32560.1 homoserine O-acetyltransferase [Synchytrium microbalum]
MALRSPSTSGRLFARIQHQHPTLHSKAHYSKPTNAVRQSVSMDLPHHRYYPQPISAKAQIPPIATTNTTLAPAATILPTLQHQQPIPVKPVSKSVDSSTHRSSKPSNAPLEFPCLEKNAERERSLDGGPEPDYQNVVSGYSLYHHNAPFYTHHGGVLPEFHLAYETWGKLNEKRDNVILVHTGLSASSHAKSHAGNMSPGWWEKFIGPGHALDTNKFFIICTNVLGGCYGSTGPASIDPSDGERYATRFPIVTIFDMVRAQFRLLDHLGIDKLYASVGASMGGMQSLAAGALYPDRVGRIVSISAAARSHPYSIALRHTQRQVLMADPHWNKGFYYNGIPPHVGMKLSRQIATITYRSGPEWEKRFGRRRSRPDEVPALCPDFLIETYLDHQGERWCLQYDPNSFLYISKAMDLFDMSAPLPLDPNIQPHTRKSHTKSTDKQSCSVPAVNISDESTHYQPTNPQQDMKQLVDGLSPAKHIPTLVLGVQSDLLFPVWQQREVADALRQGGNDHVTYYELDAMYGHDTFLIDLVGVGGAVSGALAMK